MKALKQALIDLQSTEPHFQAVVFTRNINAHAGIVKMVQALGISTYQLTSGATMKQRHKSIREFQTPAAKPRVLVASMNIGSCGVTLTEANRVYLMEPSFDPAAEVQCAGRIHRLGQTQDVLVTRFLFVNSIDAATIQLHEKFKKNELVVEGGKVSRDGVNLLLSM